MLKFLRMSHSVLGLSFVSSPIVIVISWIGLLSVVWTLLVASAWKWWGGESWRELSNAESTHLPPPSIHTTSNHHYPFIFQAFHSSLVSGLEQVSINDQKKEISWGVSGRGSQDIFGETVPQILMLQMIKVKKYQNCSKIWIDKEKLGMKWSKKLGNASCVYSAWTQILTLHPPPWIFSLVSAWLAKNIHLSLRFQCKMCGKRCICYKKCNQTHAT